MDGECGCEVGEGELDWLEGRVRTAGRMLAVEAWRCSDPPLRDEMSSVVRRIQAVIDLYEKRGRSGVQSVSATDYLEGWRRRLAPGPTDEDGRVRLKFAVETGALSNEGALVLGLSINEAVADALVQAQRGPACMITLRLGCGSSACRLSVADHRGGADGFGLAWVRRLFRDLARDFVSRPDATGLSLHVLFERDDEAIPLGDIAPRGHGTEWPTRTVRSAEEAIHGRRYR